MSHVIGYQRMAAKWVVFMMGLIFSVVLCATASAADPTQGPGGPILVVTSNTATFGNYYAEILRTEGLNEFAVADISTVTPALLANYDVVIVAKMAVPAAQVTTLGNWVNAGGNLIVMAPDASLAGVLGIVPTGSALASGYLLIDTSASPGNGIVGETMQFHSPANLFTTNGAARIATLYASAATPTAYPAVTLNTSGQGRAAAFAFDLAESVVYTRQGNPAWAAQERDGFAPIRSDDKFFGAASGDPQPDWIDLTKVAIPQADEQQRLLVNLLLKMNPKPVPRFWYLPNGKKAAIVMTGDDHGNGGTAGRFDQFTASSTPGCSVANWECIRGTSYIYASTPLTDAQAATYNANGFEIGLHVNTGCADFTRTSLISFYTDQLADWKSKYQSLPSPTTERHHCIVWSDWSTAAQIELSFGMRLDTSYYFWPPSWVNNVPGLFNGSAMPMRFANLDGTYVDVYMAASQMTDESGQSFPYTVDTLLDRATGSQGYYGVYTINAHTDAVDSLEATTTVASAQAHGVPVVTSRQMLAWLDGRNASSFGAQSWTGGTLNFSVSQDPAANGLQGMLPTRNASGVLNALTRGGAPVAFTVAGIKGVEYALFAAASGSYAATYAADTTAPQAVQTSPAGGATGVSVSVHPTVSFGEAMDPSSVSAASFDLRDAANNLVSASVTYDAASRSAILTPSAPLAAQTLYTATVHGGSADPRVKDASGNPLAANVSWTFTTATPPAPATCPCDVFGPNAVPANAAVADPNAVELGVRFTSDVAGTVTGIRFYKGATNTGTHVGNLWTSAGVNLGTVTFTAETGSGWQQMNFSAPVAIAANTVYIASYFAPNGNYAADAAYFAGAGVDNAPLHLLKDGAAGGNGLYNYSAASSFPASSYNATNYWVEPVFSSGAAVDTTAPAVTGTSPSAGATAVSTTASVTATFSEAIDPTTLNASTFKVTAGADVVVAGAVSYASATNTVSFTPTTTLPASTTLTANLVGGPGGIKDVAGNALAANVTWNFTTASGAPSCGAAPNPIVAENCLTGNPASEWDVSGAGDTSILGYATQISVNRGSTINFKVDTNATAYQINIYRMGYYGGMGARKVASISPSATLPQNQPSCLSDASTGLLDCGNWGVSAAWSVPATAVSGVYFAKVIRTDTGGASHIFFVVRNDSSTSDLLYQTSDTTWQAYNEYGGNSLYVGAPAGRAYKVSYNRPFTTRTTAGGQDWVFNAEYPMIRWLESNGYDVSYFSGIDADQSGSTILKHKTFLSVGHDEYWSAAQRSNVEAARAAGVNLAFFSGNEVFWKTRWENSIDGSNTPYRTLVSYKETTANAKIDPTATWTGTWRDPRFSPPADGGRPENGLTGTLFMNNDTGVEYAITVPAADGQMRLWRNTSIASLAAGTTATLPVGTLGYEWDTDPDNGFRPPGIVRNSTTTITSTGVLQDWGTTYGQGTLTHYLTFYKHPSGAKVFSSGTIQWSWGLDSNHDRGSLPVDPRMQQATVNLLADMNAQPASLQAGLVIASPSSDATAPTSVITSPSAGTTLPPNISVTVTGTATDSGGGVVGGVEVSTDGGGTWHPATGRGTWTYTWTPTASAAAVIKSRAVDDSGNLEAPGAGVSVNVGAQACPCSIWSLNAAPVMAADSDPGAVNIGVKFTSDVAGTITGLRFYKGTGNTGTHVGSLWTSGGVSLGTVTFTNETASGWQTATFATPITITANTVYVASYLAPAGHYAGDNSAFLSAGVDNPPLHALKDGVNGGNGVYAYGSTQIFPASTYGSSNYWVDVLFAPGGADATPPTVTTVTPASGATAVSTASTVSATFSEAMDPSTVTAANVALRDANAGLVASTVAYNATTQTVTLTPSAALAGTATYTATISTGVKDTSGNAMAAAKTWSFTTAAAADTTPPTVLSVTPASGATGVSSATPVTATFSEAMSASTVSTSTVSLRNASNALVTATVTYNATTHVVVLTPSTALAASTVFTVTISTGVKDAAGNAMAAARSWSFTTAATLDTTPPTVSVVSPANAATGVSATAAVTATFSEAMDASTINATNFTLKNASNVPVAATVGYDSTSRVASLIPTAPLPGVASYTATITTGVKDTAGNAMAATRTWSFSTVDTSAPTVSGFTPASGATGLATNTKVTVTFSEAMTASTVTATNIQLRDASGNLVTSTVAYVASTRVATLTPSATLANLATYTASVGTGVKDSAGNALAAAKSWSFTTVADTTAPTVSSTSPANNATFVSRTVKPTVTFSEAMTASTISASSIVLRNASGAVIAATVTYNPTTRVATVSPSATLGALAAYTLTINGGTTGTVVRDLGGNAMAANRVVTFRTTL